MNQLEELQDRLGVSYLFIGHDLATVAHISHHRRMYLGQIVELAEASNSATSPPPLHQALFNRRPAGPPRRQARAPHDLREVPSASRRPPAAASTPAANGDGEMRRRSPGAQEVAPGHTVACHLY